MCSFLFGFNIEKVVNIERLFFNIRPIALQVQEKTEMIITQL